MDYYEAWQNMSIEDQWFLDDPFDKDGNEIHGWHFTSGEKYDASLPLPSFTRIRQEGAILPVSFGGLNVPYVNQTIKNALSEACKENVQFIPIEIKGMNCKYYIMNVIELVDAVDDSSEIERYTENQILDDPERANRIKYLRRLVLNSKKIKESKKIFRLGLWKSHIYVDEKIKEIIESVEKRHGMSFKKVPLK